MKSRREREAFLRAQEEIAEWDALEGAVEPSAIPRELLVYVNAELMNALNRRAVRHGRSPAAEAANVLAFVLDGGGPLVGRQKCCLCGCGECFVGRGRYVKGHADRVRKRRWRERRRVAGKPDR